MSKKKINNDEYYMRTIKLEFIPDQYVETMLRKNCSYRHFLYNKCVEIVRSLEENHPNHYIGDFNGYDLLAYIRDEYEKNILYDNRPEWMEDYDYYFRGISECVVDDIMTTIERIIIERSKGNKSEMHFMKYNPNKISFRIKNKIDYRKPKKSNGLYGNNSIVLTENPYIIGVKINNGYGYPIGVHLRESISKFHINFNEIREIAFKFHNEKWYLCLIYRDYDTIIRDSIDVRYDRKKVAGIDLGEINPVVIYNGRKIKKIPNHLEFPKDKIKRVTRRLSRLQKVLRKKYSFEREELGISQSKNYYKVLAKYHKANDHLVNIKKDWHFKLAHWIVTHYKNIVVDEFHDHIIRKDSNYSNIKRKAFNTSMNNRAMFDFMQRLIYMSRKYNTNYFKPKNEIETTNTCNLCGNINKIKLTLDQRKFECEHCGYSIDRDDNASINCYNAYMNNMIDYVY